MGSFRSHLSDTREALGVFAVRVRAGVHAIDLYLHRLFPERQIMLRVEGRVSYASLSRRFQMSVVALLLVAAGWVSYTTSAVMVHEEELAAKDAEIANVRVAYRSLLGEVADYQKRFSTIARNLEDNYSLMLSLFGKDSPIQKNLTAMKTNLKGNAKGQKEVARVRKMLTDQLVNIEDRMKQLSGRSFVLKDNLEVVEKDLQTALGERNKALFESTRMRQDIKALENRLVELEESQNTAVTRLTEQTVDFVNSMERVVEMTGIKVASLVTFNDADSADQGGPFVAVSEPKDFPAGRLKANLTNLESHLDHSDRLREAVASIPFAPPMTSYRITSSYGKRKDPVNKRWGMHYGLDMSHVFKAPVYAPSPGVVKFSGWKGNFGKLVEIDHGNGIVTRYGHLHKALVKKGQKVKFGDRIGLVGSTGRSTGPHLHYEVVFKGKSMNPMKFIKAGRYVFQK